MHSKRVLVECHSEQAVRSAELVELDQLSRHDELVAPGLPTICRWLGYSSSGSASVWFTKSREQPLITAPKEEQLINSTCGCLAMMLST